MREFSRKTRIEAWLRSRGCCGLCGGVLQPARYEFDHIIPYFLSRDSSVDNCAVLCMPCHRAHKTADDAAIIAKVKRIEAKHNGTWPKSKYRLRSRGFQKRGDQ